MNLTGTEIAVALLTHAASRDTSDDLAYAKTLLDLLGSVDASTRMGAIAGLASIAAALLEQLAVERGVPREALLIDIGQAVAQAAQDEL